VCPPYVRPAVFFSPHPDDETIGMGGAIRQAVREGRTVIVELMTASGRDTWLCDLDTAHANPTHPSFHPGPYKNCPGPNGMRQARINEFLDAVQKLGVTGVRIDSFEDGLLTPEEVATRGRFWVNRQDPGLTLTGTAGPQDPSPHSDHIAVYNGLRMLHYPNTTWQRVYQYQEYSSFPARIPGARTLTPEDCEAKKQALAAYKVWDPAHGRFAYGWLHSSNPLFYAANNSCFEYVISDQPEARDSISTPTTPASRSATPAR
jgi:LmbE family N-acetylglucosaminyl deacetylase